MAYKLLALDVDGTLVRRDGTIHEDDQRAIQRLKATGVPVTIATGRLYSGTRHVARSIGVTGPLACVDGSHIVDAEGSKHHHVRTLSGAAASTLKRVVSRHQPACFLFAEDAIVYDAVGEPFAPYVKTWSPSLQCVERVSSHPSWEHEAGVMALVAVGSEAQIRDAEAEIRAELDERAFVASFPVSRAQSTYGMVVRAAGSTKGTAVTWMAAYYGCSVDEVVVVGDWINDVPMFQTAGRSFAMMQAPEPVKRAATDTLGAHGDLGGGVAEAIRRAFDV
ncbi:HAD family hydrolase [Chondromyces crocatus]|uniref:Haloacid dehalogenase n=1 Tax=Chondromyces crocatus TaxID=52 RepID=A0A0K1E5Q3_CHOCO|nr:HAD family hydrolase [Chondromyces crocatus]AKT36169.1 uncharacterized protein CMC5_002830 [Chondromyces crocatus]